MSRLWGKQQRVALGLVMAALAACLFTLQALAQEPPRNPHLINSPWTGGHGGPAQQASTALPGPQSATPRVEIHRFQEEAGTRFGTSPFHVLGEVYPGTGGSRALWGASLTHVYKYELGPDGLRFIDTSKINALPFWIGWNLFGLADGRIIVPNPSGLRLREARGTPCFGKDASLLVFRDGGVPGSGIECVGKFAFSPEVLQAACGWQRSVAGVNGVITGVTYTGEIVVVLGHQSRARENRGKEGWLAVIDNDLTRIEACTRLGPSIPSNQLPIEPVGADQSLIYAATDEAMVALRYTASTKSLEEVARVRVPYRRRTGTTPTLVGFGDGPRFIVGVDAQCAVVKVLTGEILCTENDPRPSRLVAFRRPAGSGLPEKGFGEDVGVDLPAFIETVENSPAVSGYDVVVANYSGYWQLGEKDGREDFARGLVKASYDPEAERFQIDWSRADIQFSGVPTISAATNLVYGSGVEGATTYFYGLRLNEDATGPAGETVIRVPVGPAPTSRRDKDGFYDAGNNILINEDGSAVWPAGNALVRIVD